MLTDMDYPKLYDLSSDYIELRNDLDRVKDKCNEMLDMMEQILELIQSLKPQDYERRKKTGRRTSKDR